jgi:hypothetical protein
MSKSEKIRAHLRKHPKAKVSTIAKKYECSRQLVHNVITQERKKRDEKKLDRVTPTEDGDNARKTPLNKRVKVSRSFLWGAIKYERYE